MSHQAIARKWRPRVFEEIAGQDHVSKTLQNAIRLGRIHHAFLLTGARGVGKTSAARILARALNCEKGPAPNPCNECSACTQMLAGTYPDLIEIDAASHNSVDDIRDLVEKVRYTPQSGTYKVYIIDEVHMVTKQGFNALLKTLEEPPAHVVFILATTDPQQLLDTVISRCQRFDFKMIPVRTIYEHLGAVAKAEGVSVPDGSLMVMAREGAGSMRDAQSLLDQVLSFSSGSVTEEEVTEILGFIDRSILYDVLQGALDGHAGPALEQLSKVATYGYDVRSFANYLLEAVRNVTLVRQVRDGGRLLDLPDGEVTRLTDLARDRDPDRLHRQFDILADAVDAITRSEQPILLLEMAVVKMAAVRDFAPIQSLVDRLEALERRLRKAGATVPPNTRGAESPPVQSPLPARATAPAPTVQEAPTPRATPTPPRATPTPPPAPREAGRPPADDIGHAAISPDDMGIPANGPPPAPFEEDVLPPTSSAPDPGFAEAVRPSEPPLRPNPEPDTAVLGKLLGYKRTGGPEAPKPPEETPATEAPEPVQTRPEPVQTRPEPVPQPVDVAPPPEPPPAPPAPPQARAETPQSRPEPPRAAPPRPPPSTATEIAEAAERIDPPGSDLCDATRWRRFVFGLREREDVGPLIGALQRSGFLGAEGSTISIGFGSEIAVRQMQSLSGGPNMQILLDAEFGDGVELAWSLDVEDRRARSLAEELVLLRHNKEAELRGAGRDDSAVQLVLSTFPGADIGDVKLPDDLEIDDVR